MSKPTPDSADHLSREEMQNWLRQELADLDRAVDLRTKEARDLVTTYAAGKISSREAQERFFKYNKRWPEALPGTHTVQGATDADILAEIDEARHPQFAERLIEKSKQRPQKSGPE